MIVDLLWFDHMWVIWIALLVFFLLTEGLSQNFVTIWLAAGSIGGLAIERLYFSLFWQITAFALVSILSLAFLRPLCLRVLHSQTQATNIAALIGKKARTLTIIPPDETGETGQAKVGGQTWSAITDSDQEIPADTLAEIQEIRGVKLILKNSDEAKDLSST